jgi:tRNA pseudouridine55 synthase
MDSATRDACLRPVDALLSTLPIVRLGVAEAKRFLQGQRLRLAELPPVVIVEKPATNEPGGENAGADTRVRVYRDEDGALLGVARAGSGVLSPERLIVTAAASA